ncbi:Uncharacterized protein APZ42_024139 [Daphnia magna]|uniref:Uncharacterized protein n=1 Tax=Daphnia magna TaxID=35525 RepID=A0A0P6IXY0_9CRUS|nr:Uncharacterized protein APZ42_024139 [Daphnia magna]
MKTFCPADNIANGVIPCPCKSPQNNLPYYGLITSQVKQGTENATYTDKFTSRKFRIFSGAVQLQLA